MEQGQVERVRSGDLVWVAVILLAGLALRLWLVPHRWIDPDEGAHLMDGKLVVGGLVPYADFGARQALYTYLMAGIIAAFGPDYRVARVIVALVSIAGALVVFLLADRLFGRRVAVVATLVFTFLPLGVICTVHTEPWAVLFSGLAIYTLAGALDEPSRAARWVLTGIFLSLTFYVRESGLGVAFGVVLFLALHSFLEAGRRARHYALIAAGFLTPCLLFGLYFSRYLTFGDWWASPLNPLHVALQHVGRATRALSTGGTMRGAAAGFFRTSDQSLSSTLHTVQAVFAYHAVLALGVVGSIIFLAASRRRGGADTSRSRRSHLLLLCWLGGLGLAYGYWALRRGFLPQYAEEFLPPAAILLAWTVVEAVSRWGFERDAVAISAGFALYLAGVFWLYRTHETVDLPRYAAFLVPAVALALLHLPEPHRFRRWLVLVAAIGAWLLLASFGPFPHALQRYLKLLVVPALFAIIPVVSRDAAPEARRSLVWFGACCCILVVGGYTFANVWRRLDHGAWTPEVVRQVSAHLRANSAPDDEIMSGGVIWEFQADRRPIANISHPSVFILGMSRADAELVEAQLATRPPRFIVLDGFTERTYGANLPDFDRVLQQQYALEMNLTGSSFPVRVYRLREAPVAGRQ